MDFSHLLEMQCMLMSLMIVGYIIDRIGMIDVNGRKMLTDIVVGVTLPCNIVNSFDIELDMSVVMSGIQIIIIAIVILSGSMLFGKFLYRGYHDSKKKVLEYSTVFSNAGILGNPVAEGAFGSMGLLYASLYLIPVRILLWSFGLTYFTDETSTKGLLKKALTHPCIIAVFIGLLLMFTPLTLTGFVQRTVGSIAAANTALSMFLVGAILGSVKWREMVDKDTVYYCFVRLFLIPGIVLGCLWIAGVDKVVGGTAVLMSAMPAAVVTAALALKYGRDADFAAKIVVLSTILSVVTAPAWGFLFTVL
ncbi:MAG: AEC family transporter [Lachnospiraceae bacterium]|nr:AEC family transporter [Lachnospiraceae bacterium]